MSHCKIEHLLLVFYIQKNFTTASKTVYIYVFVCFFQNNSGQNWSRFCAGKLQQQLNKLDF